MLNSALRRGDAMGSDGYVFPDLLPGHYESGTVAVIYPKAARYARVDERNRDKIMGRHLLAGQTVIRLLPEDEV